MAPSQVRPTPAVTRDRSLRVFQLGLEQAQRLWHRGYAWTRAWAAAHTPEPCSGPIRPPRDPLVHPHQDAVGGLSIPIRSYPYRGCCFLNWW